MEKFWLCRFVRASVLVTTLVVSILGDSARADSPAAAPSVPPAIPLASPESVGVRGEHLSRIGPLVEASIEAQEIPGCVVLVLRGGRVVFHEAYGHRQLKPTALPMEKNTVFDMASITKPVATATSIMLLVERGEVRIHDRYGRFIKEFRQNGKDDVTLFQMLTHQAGFIPDSPLSEYKAPEEIWPRLWKLGLEYEPTTKFVYSDVGFQMLGKLVEHQSGQPLNEFAKQNIFAPLGMRETGFLPSSDLRDRAATTEQREGRWMQGEVHDPRSYAMDGVAGHAGLFSTATDLARYAQMMLGNGAYAGVRILSPQTVATMCESHTVAGKDRRGLGWDKRSRFSSNRGELMTDKAVGHGGFTGTAMWIDPGLDLAVIFLSNRVHPDGKGTANNLAGRIASVAAAAICDPQKLKTTPKPQSDERGVLNGVDVLFRDKFAPIAGKRIGLITNHTGIDKSGRRTIDLLHQSADVDLKVIFSPEHGIQGVLDEKVGDARDEKTGLKIYSLYGADRTPDKSALAEVDVLVFDIQDIGARFYTYISTMLNSMKAASAAGKRFVVLDRPNPLGGLATAGPVLDDGKQDFVGCHTIAVQHGMTVGELAMMFKDELKLDLDVQIVKVENWQRAMLWDQTGLRWVNPSPNMRSWNEALLYPGIGLLETTNLSVGRGTDRPFEIVGAPYIDESTFAAALNAASTPGLRFVPRKITPTASKFKQEVCGAVDIVITDRRKVQTVEAGITMATVLRRLYPNDWKLDSFNRLLCDDAVLQSVTDGRSAEEIVDSYQEELDEFRARRQKYLLY